MSVNIEIYGVIMGMREGKGARRDLLKEENS